MVRLAQKKGVYLIHLDEPIAGHAQHYIGKARDIAFRFQEHQHGTGSRLLNAANERGITYRIVRTWAEAPSGFERYLKAWKSARQLCPVCNPSLRRRRKRRAGARKMTPYQLRRFSYQPPVAQPTPLPVGTDGDYLDDLPFF